MASEFSLGTAALGTEIDLTGLKQGQDKAKSETDNWLGGLQSTAKKGFGGLQKTVGIGLLGGLGIVTGGLAALTAEFSDSIELAKVQQDAEEQLAAVLASTGEAAGLTAEEIKAMASELQTVTNFGDEAIISGQNLLLTFTNIGEDVFPAATETMLDMSQALGQDMKSSAVQLGKALNDPIAGISALGRVGVTFTDEQKAMIEAMVEAGDVARAQTLILAELGREFGGSARALADPADQLANSWGDFKEVIGGAVLPILENLQATALPLVNRAIGVVTSAIDYFRFTISSGDWGNDFIMGLPELLRPIVQLLGQGIVKFQETGSVLESLKAVFDTVAPSVSTAISLFQYLRFTLASGDWANDFLVDLPEQIKPFVSALGEAIVTVRDAIASFVSWKDVLLAVGVVAATIIIPILAGLVASIAPVIAVAAALVGGIALLRNAWESDFLGMRTALIAFWENSVKPAFVQVQAWAQDNLPQALATLETFWKEHLLPAMRAVWQFIQTSLIPLFGALVNVWFAAIKLELAALQVAWQVVLLPALRTVWAFVKDYVIPIFDGMSGSIGGISGVISGVIGWLDTLAQKFNSLADNIPEWLIPGSPTPFETGLRGIADAMKQAARAGDLLDSSLATRDLVTVGMGNGGNFSVTQNIQSTDPVAAGGESASRLRDIQRRRGRS